MASSKDDREDERPRLLAPSFGPRRRTSALDAQNSEPGLGLHRRRMSNDGQEHKKHADHGKHESGAKHAKHIRLQAPSNAPRSSVSSIYMGSYSPRRSRGSIRDPSTSIPPTPRASVSHARLESLLQDLNLDLETYGVEETRDGFFDAPFYKPVKVDHEDLMRDAEYTLPVAFQKPNPLSPKAFFPHQWNDIKDVYTAVTTTRAGIKLSKSFLGFFIAYILCLVPVIQAWLGPYSYIMVLSAIINHPGRTVGAQIDGAFLTSIGTAAGLGWGAFALWLSDSTAVARRGYGGILATFLLIFMGTIAALRCYFVRIYQMVICAGIAIAYTCLADTVLEVDWRKLFNFGIPWLFGQAICMLVCCTVFPDAGARPLAVSLHDALGVMQDGLAIPQPDPVMLHRRLALTFVNLSQAHRDLVLDITITRFKPTDIASLRNLMQGVIRSLLSLKMETRLFDDFDSVPTPAERRSRSNTPKPDTDSSNESPLGEHDAVIDIDSQEEPPLMFRTSTGDKAVRLVASRLADPTAQLISSMKAALARCDAVLMNMSGYRKYLGPPPDISTDIVGCLTKLRKASIKYDNEQDSLMDNTDLPPTYSDHPEVVELFLFVHPIRQAARTVEDLLVKVMEMQQRRRGWRLYLPSYPFGKSLQRTNAQVRHDRGGLTAGFYFQSQHQLAKTMQGMASAYKPLPRRQAHEKSEERPAAVTRTDTIGKYEEEKEAAMNKKLQASKQKRFRYKLWMVLHRLQGFETRFALKVAITTSLLAVPAWLNQSRGWWNANESWWAVVSKS